MIIIPAAVKANQFLFHQLADFRPCGVDHPNNAFSFPCLLPVHQQQVREHFNIKKHQCLIHRCLRLFLRNIRGLLQPELQHLFFVQGNLYGASVPFGFFLKVLAEISQLSRHLHAGILLVVALCGECGNRRPHVPNIILDSGFIGIVQCLLDQTHGRRRIRLGNIFLQAFGDNVPNVLLVLNALKVNHIVLFLLSRQSAADPCHGNVVAEAQPPPQAAFPREHLDLNIFVIDAVQFGRIPFINIMKVQSLSSLAVFCIRFRPLVRSLQVQQSVFFSFRVLEIKINDDMIERWPDKMKLPCVNILQRCPAAAPGDNRLASSFRFFFAVLRLTIRKHFIQKTFRLIQHNAQRRIVMGDAFLPEGIVIKPFLVQPDQQAPHLLSVRHPSPVLEFPVIGFHLACKLILGKMVRNPGLFAILGPKQI